MAGTSTIIQINMPRKYKITTKRISVKEAEMLEALGVIKDFYRFTDVMEAAGWIHSNRKPDFYCTSKGKTRHFKYVHEKNKPEKS